jgi:glucan 1,3-beta-glucosidase
LILNFDFTMAARISAIMLALAFVPLSTAASGVRATIPTASPQGYIAKAPGKINVASASASGSYATPAAPSAAAAPSAGSSSYWLASIKRQGAPPFGAQGYTVYRNVVTSYGAKGDGVTDDTAAINKAISDGNRCGQGCNSSTTSPAIVYFPAGTYLVSGSIQQYYYTQLIGDALNPPTIKVAATFQGGNVIDSDPALPQGGNWYTNTDNFFRQIRNLVIDVTAVPANISINCLHWQVAQATSLQNVRFEMIKGSSQQTGIFMDNGSGGFMGDLVFNGGMQAMFLGNQQFTSRNITINNCGTGIYMNWNWVWTLKSININGCKTGIFMAGANGNGQTVGSVLLQDSVIRNTMVGVKSGFNATSLPPSGGTLIIDNVDFTGTPTGVQNAAGQILAGGSVVQGFILGPSYAGSHATRSLGTAKLPAKPPGLMANGKVYERSRPQYENVPVSSFVSLKSAGAKGDGKTDDTQAIQGAINALQDGQVLYVDHGAYVVTRTVNVPGNRNVKITGEIWPMIMASGSFFANATNPQPVFRIGSANDTGSVELSDLVFQTLGPAPGAVLIEWNSNAATQGANGLWDVHARVGGTAGTLLQGDRCAKNPKVTSSGNPACEGAHTLFHATASASVLMENTWFWTADHDIDPSPLQPQVDIFTGRGILIESTNPVWMYATASEHNVFYQYEFNGARTVYMSVLQAETPYFQSNPAAPAPFTASQASDPTFDGKPGSMAWGMRVVDSQDLFMFGAG